MLATPLRRATLADLPQAVERPLYDLDARRPGIVHLGFGGFHRAHLARYTHDRMQQDARALHWGIVGVGLRPADRASIAPLRSQDHLYTLVERSADTDRGAVIGSVVETITADEGGERVLDRMAGARIVSLTVTEAGYGLDPATRRLDSTLAAVAQDLAAPWSPQTPVGLLVEALRRRRDAGGRGFTALSCDNIPGNGRVLRQAVLDYAERIDPALAGWIGEAARFPASMVDRITPVARPQDRALVRDAFGIEDGWPIVCEDFRQWVIEDDFADGRPDWDGARAQFVPSVEPYELMKLRLLNASHLAIAGIGRLIGYAYVHEAMTDPDLRLYMQRLMDEETGPTLAPVPGVDLPAYKAQLIARFANPKIADTLDRVNADAPLNYLLDPLRDRLQSGGGITLLALALAAWMRRVRGVDEAGALLPVRHAEADELRRRAELGGADPRPLLALTRLFGDLGQNETLVAALGRSLKALEGGGARVALAAALG